MTDKSVPKTGGMNPYKLLDQACYKRTYPDKVTADAALARIHSRPGKEPKPIASYRCKSCGKWHLTSKQAWRAS